MLVSPAILKLAVPAFLVGVSAINWLTLTSDVAPVAQSSAVVAIGSREHGSPAVNRRRQVEANAAAADGDGGDAARLLGIIREARAEQAATGDALAGIASQPSSPLAAAEGELARARDELADLLHAGSGVADLERVKAEILSLEAKRDGLIDPEVARLRATFGAAQKREEEAKLALGRLKAEAHENHLAQQDAASWKPYTAPAWSLSDAQGEPVSLSQFLGSPTLIIFCPGSETSLGLEGLEAILASADKLARTGVKLVAISTESAERLRASKLSIAKSGSIRVLADETRATFAAYRAYEESTMDTQHGMYLLDAAGRVIWQEVSADPFRDMRWLVAQAERLFGSAR